MITKQEIANVLKDYVDSSVTIFANRMPNKLNNQTAKRIISVSDSSMDGDADVKTEEYDQKSFKLTVRYNEIEADSEEFCNTLYESIKNIRNVQINDIDEWLFTWKIKKPVSTGKVKDNIYEYQIEFTIIYTR